MTLTVEHLSFRYHERTILSDISFEIQRGKLLSVLGPNGAGKSTLFKCILGILKGYTGTIMVNDMQLSRLSPGETSCLLAYIPQQHNPSFGYSALDMVLMGTTRQFSPFSQPGKDQVFEAMEALEQMGIEALADRNFSRLSGGEQQLVLIARAIVQRAGILIMDEPTSSLDYGNQLRVLQQVRSLTQEGYTVLLSTHNPQHALTFSSHVLALSAGHVAAFGETQDVLTTTLIRELYRIDAEFLDTPAGRVISPILF